MNEERRIKKCVGPIIYNPEGKIFLMKSSKWRQNKKDKFGGVWIVPGGEIEKNENGQEKETAEEALEREINEELGINLGKIEYVGESHKSGEDNFIKPNIDFHFIDFLASTEQSNIRPNHEISEYCWVTVEEAKQLPLLDTTAAFIKKCEATLKEKIIEFQKELRIDKK